MVWVQHEEEDLPYGSPDWQLAPPLSPAAGETRLRKTYRDAFAGTGLAGLLADLDVGHVLVAGSQSDYCVRTAAQRAAAEGLDVTLVGDCHTTVDARTPAGTLPAAQVVAHTNAYFAGLRYPGVRVRVAEAAAVALG